MTDDELIERLVAITSHVLDQPELLAEWSRDWWPFNSKLSISESELPLVALVPDSVDEVVAILRLADEAGRGIVLRGAGTNMSGAVRPSPGAILLDLRGLNVIDAVDPVNCTVRVDAGVHGGELEERLNELGFTLGHFPKSLNISTVGGWIAMGSIGAYATGYGGIEELLVAIEVVLPNGEVIQEKPAPHRGVGPRWRNLFVGSEGSFGIVVSATLRVRLLPQSRRVHAFSLPSFNSALVCMRGLVQTGLAPSAVALFDEAETGVLGVQGGGHMLVVAFDGLAALVDVTERLWGEAIVIAGGRFLEKQPALAWQSRQFRCDWMIDGNENEGSIADMVDVAAPWSAAEAIANAGRGALANYAETVWVRVEHAYPTGVSLTFVFQIERESAFEAYQRAFIELMRVVIDLGGTIAHHGGIGQARLPWFEEQIGSGIDLLRAVKRAVDPQHLLNPGGLGLDG